MAANIVSALTTSAGCGDGTFPLSKLTCVNVNINNFGFLSISLRKDTSQHSVKFVFFNVKQMKELIQLIPRMDGILRKTDASNKQCIEVSLKSGEKRMIGFSHNKKLFVEIASYNKTSIDPLAPAAPDPTRIKKAKTDDTSMTKLKHQCVTLTLSEWFNLRDKAEEVLNCVVSMQMDLNNRNEGLAAIEDSVVSSTVPNFFWSSLDDDGNEDEGPHPYYIEDHCMRDGQLFQKERKRKERIVIRSEQVTTPSVARVMRACYVHQARDLIEKCKHVNCKGCQEGGYFDENAPEHFIEDEGCKANWVKEVDELYAKIRCSIDDQLLKKMALCFFDEIGCIGIAGEIDQYEYTYDGELLDSIYSKTGYFDKSLLESILYAKIEYRKNVPPGEACEFSDDDNDEAPKGLTPETAQKCLV
jgi:hypothetical protein